MLMNKGKLDRLFASVRGERAVRPADDSAGRVMGAIHREPHRRPAVTVFDELTQLFPRLAWAATVVIGLGLASELYFSLTGSTSLATDLAEVAEQWRFAGELTP